MTGPEPRPPVAEDATTGAPWVTDAALSVVHAIRTGWPTLPEILRFAGECEDLAGRDRTGQTAPLWAALAELGHALAASQIEAITSASTSSDDEPSSSAETRG